VGWTADRTARCSKLWADGISAGLIAEDLGGVTRDAVIGKVNRLGLLRMKGRQTLARLSDPRSAHRSRLKRTRARMTA